MVVQRLQLESRFMSVAVIKKKHKKHPQYAHGFKLLVADIAKHVEGLAVKTVKCHNTP